MGMYEQKPGIDRAETEAGLTGSDAFEEHKAQLILATFWKSQSSALSGSLLFLLILLLVLLLA